jgi:hypothetical protein
MAEHDSRPGYVGRSSRMGRVSKVSLLRRIKHVYTEEKKSDDTDKTQDLGNNK